MSGCGDPSSWILSRMCVCVLHSCVYGVVPARLPARGTEQLKLQNPEDAAEARRLADEQNVRIMTFAEVVEMGRLDRSPLTRPSSEDIYTICYTSGAGSHASEAELLH
eukprot:GHVU01205378.1.p4 GENE.GHVU01205378.1~~GHVU01205378.1.p4  ORF type:complete len:108 (-),score=17.65 GHVU01205378.1:136-459(-)